MKVSPFVATFGHGWALGPTPQGGTEWSTQNEVASWRLGSRGRMRAQKGETKSKLIVISRSGCDWIREVATDYRRECDWVRCDCRGLSRNSFSPNRFES